MAKLKAIIPVAGAGTRLRPFTYSHPKSLIPVAGKPIISYIIEDLKNEGIVDFIFIVGYFGEKIVDYVKKNHPNLSCEFVFQAKREGLGQAVYLAKEYIELQNELIIFLGDSLMEVPKSFYTTTSSTLAIKKVKNPSKFGVVELNDQKEITHFVEKPKFPKSNYALTGLYRIVESSLLLEILEKQIKEDIRTEGEFLLTDAFNEMIKAGVVFKTQEANQWLDVGDGDVLLNSNNLLLDKFGGHISNTVKVENSDIMEPVYLAENCEIVNSIIGPYISMGANTKIENSIIENGIIGSYSVLDKMKLTEFVIGSDSSIKGATQTITVGDNTEIDFSK